MAQVTRSPGARRSWRRRHRPRVDRRRPGRGDVEGGTRRCGGQVVGHDV